MPSAVAFAAPMVPDDDAVVPLLLTNTEKPAAAVEAGHRRFTGDFRR